ncbi:MULTISPECIES: hypothetical protein [unclassified Methylobacterium]|jgi:hypothetical protein|uniref:hypothetical protein n=1 Tax=unclassified Methylobacterium TaxID=2615210 RepID=UPI00135476AD|nr:hypothetical protein [Methylobacterium sp. 2A]MWV22431.1 hypothetical protein [Methylobacterium sp. 2A]
MAKPATRFAEAIAEADPRKVAAMIESHGVGVTAARYRMDRALLHRVAEEGRRMKAAGETWSKPARKAA